MEAPDESEKVLKVASCKGRLEINELEFPDDFPQANYQIVISSAFTKLGEVKNFQKTLCVKAKNVGGKKK